MPVTFVRKTAWVTSLFTGSATVSVDCAGGDLLIACVKAADTITDATRNSGGETLTEVVSQIQNFRYGKIFAIANPAAGPFDLVVTGGSGGDLDVIAYVFTGYNGGSFGTPVIDVVASGASLTSSAIACEVDSIVMGMLFLRDGNTFASTDGANAANEDAAFFTHGITATKTGANPTTTLGFTWTEVDSRGAFLAFAINPAGGGGGDLLLLEEDDGECGLSGGL